MNKTLAEIKAEHMAKQSVPKPPQKKTRSPESVAAVNRVIEAFNGTIEDIEYNQGDRNE